MILYEHQFPNGKRYLGVTSSTLAERLRGGYSGMLVGRAFSKYRGEVKSRVLLEGPREVVLRLEEVFIRELGTRHPGGYNVAEGGVHTLMTSELREATRGRLTSQWSDPEWVERAREGMRRAWSPERRAAQSERARRQHEEGVLSSNTANEKRRGRAEAR